MWRKPNNTTELLVRCPSSLYFACCVVFVVFSTYVCIKASGGKHPLSCIGVCGLFAHYFFLPGCGWVCVPIYYNLAAPAQPSHRREGDPPGVRVTGSQVKSGSPEVKSSQGLPGPKEIGQGMDPLRRQHHGLSLFTATVFDRIPWEHR